jgi:starch synthase
VYPDNDEELFFAKVSETVKKLNWVPDIIHVHGWMHMLPILYEAFYKKMLYFQKQRL